MGRLKKNTNGFTIIELLVTITVFGFVVPGMVGLLNTLSKLNDRAQETTILNAAAEAKIEELRSTGFLALNNGTYDFSGDLPATIASPNANYTVSNVTPALKSIDVSITYNDYGQSKTLNYKTYIGELGVGQY